MPTINGGVCVVNGKPIDKVYSNGQQVYGRNLIVQSNLENGWLDDGGLPNDSDIDFHSDNYIATNGETMFTFSSPDYEFKGINPYRDNRIIMYDSNKNCLGSQDITSPTQTLSKSNVAYIKFSINSNDEGNTTGSVSNWLTNHRYKLEKGTITTPWTLAPEDVGVITNKIYSII